MQLPEKVKERIMNILISFLLLVGLIVILSFVSPQVYNFNKAYWNTNKIPLKTTLTYIGIVVLSIVCYVAFAILIFVFLG